MGLTQNYLTEGELKDSSWKKVLFWTTSCSRRWVFLKVFLRKNKPRGLASNTPWQVAYSEKNSSNLGIYLSQTVFHCFTFQPKLKKSTRNCSKTSRGWDLKKTFYSPICWSKMEFNLHVMRLRKHLILHEFLTYMRFCPIRF